uniref:Uncharacterized protein n=1 Tax=Eutreptiella gymnastica TaxID=73025 RepID=A0A7S4LDH0_9EUGL
MQQMGHTHAHARAHTHTRRSSCGIVVEHPSNFTTLRSTACEAPVKAGSGVDASPSPQLHAAQSGGTTPQNAPKCPEPKVPPSNRDAFLMVHASPGLPLFPANLRFREWGSGTA